MSLPDIDWSEDYKLGYGAALSKLFRRFEKEHNETATEDPHFAFYAKYTMSIIEEEMKKGGL